MSKKMVIFDFDGVLVNTLDFSFNLHKEKNKELTWKEFQDFSNGNFIDSIRKAAGKKIINLRKDFKENYENEISKISVPKVLNKSIPILSTEYLLVIVSSTSSYLINNFLVKENLREYFSDILGVDISINKTEKINKVLEKYNILPRNTVFITDSLGDILEANKCKIYSIGVTWGLHERNRLKKGNPTDIIDDPRGLIKTIENVLK